MRARRHITTLIAMSILVLVPAAGRALADEDPALVPPEPDAARSIDLARSATNRAMTGAEHDAIVEHASRSSASLDGEDLGPRAADLPTAQEGRLVLTDAAVGDLAAIATERGDVCWVLSRNATPVVVGCIPHLDAHGAAWHHSVVDGVHGVAGFVDPTSVEQVAVRLTDGRIVQPARDGSGFGWAAAAGDVPAAVQLTKASGAVVEIEIPDPAR